MIEEQASAKGSYGFSAEKINRLLKPIKIMLLNRLIIDSKAVRQTMVRSAGWRQQSLST